MVKYKETTKGDKSEENIYSESFYTGTLKWENSIWEFSENKLPTLRNQK